MFPVAAPPNAEDLAEGLQGARGWGRSFVVIWWEGTLMENRGGGCGFKGGPEVRCDFCQAGYCPVNGGQDQARLLLNGAIGLPLLCFP